MALLVKFEIGQVAARDGAITTPVTGLGWRREVSAQVFEEAAVDLSRGLHAFSKSKATGAAETAFSTTWS